ncbi:MAG: peptidylprolyl isomerase [Rudaea sp.]
MMRRILWLALGAVISLSAHALDAQTELASQGGVSLTLGDLDAFMQHIPEAQRPGFLESPARVNQMVIGILRNKQFAAQAVAHKLDADPDVKAQIAYATMEVLAEARLREFKQGLKIPSLAVAAKEQYQAHKKDYVVKENIEVQHILVSLRGRTDADAKALAEKVRQEAVAHPDTFDSLVDKYSEDSSKGTNNGHVLSATADGVDSNFAAAAKALKAPGEISAVVGTAFGYHVLKLTSRTPGRQVEFAEVKDRVEDDLKQTYIDEQRKHLIQSLDEGAPTVNPQLGEILRQRFVPAGVVSPTEAIKKTP